MNVAAAGVLANDADVDGNALTAELVSGPTSGSLNLNADGSFSYTPDAGFSGVDTFSYRANDGPASSNVSTVTIRVNPADVVISAGTVSTRLLWLDGVAHVMPVNLNERLSLGGHSVWADAGSVLSFEVTSDGTIAYHPDLEGTLTGRGTTTLTVTGSQVKIDFSDLGTRALWVDGLRTFGTTQLAPSLLPGTHTFWADGGNAFNFHVDARGIITDPDNALDGIVSGLGTSSFDINGRSVTFNAEALTAGATLWVDMLQHVSTSAFSLGLLPGRHDLWHGNGSGFSFELSPEGIVTDPSGVLDSFVDGLGTSSITLTGHTVRMDAIAIEQGGVWIDGKPMNATNEISYTLTPGGHYFFSHNTNGNLYFFNVENDGRIGAISHQTRAADGSLVTLPTPAHVVSVDPADPARLIVQGVPVTIDVAARPDVHTSWFDGWIDNNPYAMAPARTFYMLPGPHDFTVRTSPADADYRYYHFTVDNDGIVTAIDAPPGVLTGIGTNVLQMLPTTPVSVSNGILYVWGDHASNVADFVTVSTSGAGVQVTLNGAVSTFADGAVSQIIVNTGTGADTVNVERTLAGAPVTINGGAGNDIVALSNTARNLNNLQGAVTINGDAGADQVSIYDQNTPRTYTIAAPASGTGATVQRSGAALVTILGGDATSGDATTLYAGTGSDTFNVGSNPTVPFTVDGGAGNNTLVGPNVANAWSLTGPNAGRLNANLAFQNMPNLTGNMQVDVFAFSMAASVSSILRGMGGIDTLDYSGYDSTRAAIVNLATGSATAVAAGAANAAQALENVIGGAGNDMLTGNTLNNLLIGGAGNDTLLGSDGLDILMGDGGNDRLEGGNGADLLVGGAGLDTLLGQAGGDLLIGDRIDFNFNTDPNASDAVRQSVNIAALQAIMLEWGTGRTFQQRTANIAGTSSPTAQRSNGNWFLRRTANAVSPATVFDDDFLDSLSGGDATGDWQF